MKIKDSTEYAKRTGGRPAGILLAFAEPRLVNEVILHGPWRFRLVEELTRAEFNRRMAENQKRQNAVSGRARLSSARLEDAEDAPAPDENMTHFYAAEIV